MRFFVKTRRTSKIVFFTFLPLTVFLLFYLFTFLPLTAFLPNGDCRYEVRGVGFGGDVVLLLLSLVLSDDETGCARARQEGDDGGADGYYEVADECFPVDVCHFLFPFFFKWFDTLFTLRHQGSFYFFTFLLFYL